MRRRCQYTNEDSRTIYRINSCVIGDLSIISRNLYKYRLSLIISFINAVLRSKNQRVGSRDESPGDLTIGRLLRDAVTYGDKKCKVTLWSLTC